MQIFTIITQKKSANSEIYIVDQDVDCKSSNCMLSLSQNNDTPVNVRITLRRVHATTIAIEKQ
jgi:hypothetical protein